MSSHALALGLSAFAYSLARRHSRHRAYAFGTWKVEVLGGYTRGSPRPSRPGRVAADEDHARWAAATPPTASIADPEAEDRPSYQQDLWHYTVGRMVDACAAAGIFPYYGPFGDIQDEVGCEAQFRAAYVMGCVGAWSLHPVQIGIAKRVFSPRSTRSPFAKRVLEAIPDGSGVHMLDGKMQDDATYKQAQRARRPGGRCWRRRTRSWPRPTVCPGVRRRKDKQEPSKEIVPVTPPKPDADDRAWSSRRNIGERDGAQGPRAVHGAAGRDRADLGARPAQHLARRGRPLRDRRALPRGDGQGARRPAGRAARAGEPGRERPDHRRRRGAAARAARAQGHVPRDRGVPRTPIDDHPSREEHVPGNAMDDPDEIAAFHDRCSDLMRALLQELARTPDQPRPFPQIEDDMGWPRRRIASVLGGVFTVRTRDFGGRRPYHFHDERQSASGRWGCGSIRCSPRRSRGRILSRGS